jgi:hypothetical protein
MTIQRALFDEAELQMPESTTTVRLGKKVAQIPLRKKRRQAVKRLMEILEELEGKDVYIGSYDAGGRHYWLDNLRLSRLQVESFPAYYRDGSTETPGVIVLWGSRGACVRIFTDYLAAIREQEYDGYYHYLIDFHNGFWQNPVDQHRSHYECLAISRFKD